MKTVVAAALGECVHVAGVSRFLQMAEEAGWRCQVAPRLRNNPTARGHIKTHIVGGACMAVDSHGRPPGEADRLQQVVKETV